VPKPHELPYLMLNRLQPFLEQLSHALARRPTFIPQPQNLPDLVQGKTEGLRLLDKVKPISSLRPIDPITCGRSVRSWQQPKSLVVADRLHTHARRFGRPTNKPCLFHREQV